MDDIHDPRREAIPYATSLTNLKSGFPNWAHRNSFYAPSFETNFAKGQVTVRVFVILIMNPAADERWGLAYHEAVSTCQGGTGRIPKPQNYVISVIRKAWMVAVR